MQYRRKLERGIDEMNKSILYWITATFRANNPEALATDASPAVELDLQMKRLRRRWTRNFNEGSKKLAEYFAQQVQDRTDTQLRGILKKAGFTVEFNNTATMNDAFQAITRENVGLIKSIASKHLDEVQGLVMRSVSQGRDLSQLTDDLQHQFGITRKRATLIARDQNNKATAVIAKTRRADLGITQAQWMHSGGGKHPRESHVKAGRDKLVFDVSKGALIDGEYIQPGELINCRCTSRAIIPGLDDSDY